MLSSLLSAYQTHTRDPYSQAPSCVDGSRLRGCRPSHFVHVLLRYPPLHQHKVSSSSDLRGRNLKASHLWGSVLKRTTSSPIAYRLTSERVHSTIIIGVPTLISFFLPLLALYFIYHSEQKGASNVVKMKPFGFPHCANSDQASQVGQPCCRFVPRRTRQHAATRGRKRGIANLREYTISEIFG